MTYCSTPDTDAPRIQVGDSVTIRSDWSCFDGRTGTIESAPKFKFTRPHWLVRLAGFDKPLLFGERELSV